MVESTESTGIYWYYMVLLVIIWDSTKVPELGLQSPSFLMTFLTCSPPSNPWDFATDRRRHGAAALRRPVMRLRFVTTNQGKLDFLRRLVLRRREGSAVKRRFRGSGFAATFFEDLKGKSWS